MTGSENLSKVDHSRSYLAGEEMATLAAPWQRFGNGHPEKHANQHDTVNRAGEENPRPAPLSANLRETRNA